jgi:hypothetical protein
MLLLNQKGIAMKFVEVEFTKKYGFLYKGLKKLYDEGTAKMLVRIKVAKYTAKPKKK